MKVVDSGLATCCWIGGKRRNDMMGLILTTDPPALTSAKKFFASLKKW